MFCGEKVRPRKHVHHKRTVPIVQSETCSEQVIERQLDVLPVPVQQNIQATLPIECVSVQSTKIKM